MRQARERVSTAEHTFLQSFNNLISESTAKTRLFRCKKLLFFFSSIISIDARRVETFHLVFYVLADLVPGNSVACDALIRLIFMQVAFND